MYTCLYNCRTSFQAWVAGIKTCRCYIGITAKLIIPCQPVIMAESIAVILIIT